MDSILTRKDAILTAIRGMREDRTSLREQLAERVAELSDARAARDRLQALADMTYWAELTSGAAAAVGDRVRYLGRTYECVEAHTKALTRSPLDPRYWRAVE